MKPRSVVFLAIIGLGVSFISLGCGRADGPEIASVEGVVTLNGTPIEGAGVSFEPIPEGRSSFALTDADGHYELNYLPGKDGAIVGEHQVRISKFRKALKDDNGQVVDPGVPEAFPPSANSESDLKVTVKEGSNTFDFPIRMQ